jgi:hypothetical protein
MARNNAPASAISAPMLKLSCCGPRTSTIPAKPIATPIHVGADAVLRNNTQSITGIHSGALKVSRVALVSGIMLTAKNSAYQQAVPLAARRMCSPSFSVRNDAGKRQNEH